MQKTSFNYEIVIGDDCSSDNTRKILTNYKNKYPDKIKLMLNKKNVGATKNFYQTYKACTGKYIAILEGDDYWIDPYKIKKQSEYLDDNPDFSMCFTNCNAVNENNDIIKTDFVPENKKKTLTQEDLIPSYCPSTLTVMFKNNLLMTFPKEYFNVVNADFFIFIMLTDYGNAGYIDEITSNYRIHSQGIWSKCNEEFHISNNIRTFKNIFARYKAKYGSLLINLLNNLFLDLINYYKVNNKIKYYKTICSYTFFSIKYKNPSFFILIKTTLYFFFKKRYSKIIKR